MNKLTLEKVITICNLAKMPLHIIQLKTSQKSVHIITTPDRVVKAIAQASTINMQVPSNTREISHRKMACRESQAKTSS